MQNSSISFIKKIIGKNNKSKINLIYFFQTNFGYEKIDRDPILLLLRFETLKKAKQLLGVDAHLRQKIEVNFVTMVMGREFHKLSLEQITALVVYYSFRPSVTDQVPDEIRVPMDVVEEIYYVYHRGDQVKLKLLLGQMFTRHGIDFSEVTHDFASKSAPLTYWNALDQVKKGRVKMQPCELTLVPFKHCRWCGLVQQNTLRLCQECKEDLTYPDKNWFCGDECERLAMDKLHREEHVRHLEIDLGLEKQRVELELESKSAGMKKKRRAKK